MFTQEEVRHYFRYDEESGKLYWKNPTSKRTKVDQEITYLNADGYLMVGLKGGLHLVHRIIYLYVTGHWTDYPNELIDHIDRNRLNNKFDNYRLVNHSGNQHNRRLNCNSSTGYKGVTRHRGKYLAQMQVNNKRKYLGVFDCPEKAHQAYLDALNG